MIGLPLTVDLTPGWTPQSQAIYSQVQYSPLFPKGATSHLVVSIDVPAQLTINPPTPSHVMNQEQRDAMERAYWQSVELLDSGYE